MLRFYGIRFNPNGTPERFTLTFDLKSSLNALLHIHDFFKGSAEQTLQAIEEEINKQFAPANYIHRQAKSFRITAAKWFRTKEMGQFLFSSDAYYPLKLQAARILNSDRSLEEKWLEIEAHCIEFLADQPIEAIEQDLGDQNSDLSLILQMAVLFFLEQDDEVPPANLELHFVRQKFPKVIWKKQEGMTSGSDPFWAPLNLFCRASYLNNRILSGCFRQRLGGGNLLPHDESHFDKEIVNTQPPKMAIPVQSTIYDSLYPTTAPSETRILLPNDGNNEQLALVPESLPETLLSLQRLVQTQFSYDGVKHFLAILRQFSQTTNGICSFNTYKHLKTVTKLSKKGTTTENQLKIFQGVFDLLGQLKVVRHWQASSEEDEVQVVNAFVQPLEHEIIDGKKGRTLKRYLLDPMFLGTASNPISLGGHLRLIPEELFQESTHKHALLLGIASYVTGSWLAEFPHKNGILEKSAREIIEGAAFNLTPANKYRIRRKLNDELKYMEEKRYLSSMQLVRSGNGNPWEDTYQITAPKAFQQALKDQYHRPTERLCG